MEKLHTFKSFSQVREEAAKIKQLKEVSNKQSQSIEKYNSLLKEYGIASPNELDEEKRNQFFSKLVESVDLTFDTNEAISRSAVNMMNGLVNLKQMKQILDLSGSIIQDFIENEGFEFEDCVDFIAYKITEEFKGIYEGKSSKTSEGNAFGAAVTKAKEDEKDEFEFKGKTYKVTEAEEILEARSINKIQNDWTKVTGEMAELAKEWKAAEGDAKTAIVAKMKEKTAAKKALEAELDAAVAGKDKDLELAVESINVSEGFEVHYSDGVRAAKKFGSEKQAMDFAKDLIKNKKGLQFVDVFNAGSGFNSTADTDAIVAFWGDGSYTDNVAKRDSKLAAKKIEESVNLSEAEINSEEEFTEYAHVILKKAFGAEYDEAKAKETIDGILAKAEGDFGAAIGMLTSGLG